MSEIFVKTVNSDCIEAELQNIGFDCSYIHHAVKKNSYKTIKIFNLRPQEASILKQTALSLGFDAAVHRGVIDCSIASSDSILTGSEVQFRKLASALEKQPFKMKDVGAQIVGLFAEIEPIKIGKKFFDWSKPYIAGILNVTPDSFSDGGKFNEIDSAILQFVKMVEEGADIIDIGAESTRPSHTPISSDEEITRLSGILKEIADINTKYNIPISLDTRNVKTAEFGLNQGINMINDVGFAEYDTKMIDFINANNVPYVLMHNKAVKIETVDEVYKALFEKLQKFTAPVIIDVGIGFEKTIEQDFELISRMNEFLSLKKPILAGHSRKKFLHKSFDLTPHELDTATLSVSSALVAEGVNIIRVHDVKSHRLMLDVLQIIR